MTAPRLLQRALGRALGLCVIALAAAVAAVVLPAAAVAEAPQVTSHRSPGGIAFRHTRIDDRARHSIAFGWHDGFAQTLPGKEALAFLGPRLLNEGSSALARSEYSERLKDVQARTQLVGSTRFTTGSLTAPPEHLADAAALLADVLGRPALAPERFAFLQRSMAAGARQAAEEPEALARQLMHRLVLGPGPALDARVVPPQSYERLALADVAAWHKAVLARDTVVVASAGPMTQEAVGAVIDRLFAGLPEKGIAFAAPPAPKLRALARTVLLKRPVVQTILVAEGPSGLVQSPDLVAAEIARQSMLGFEGSVWRAVRERLGAAYGVNGTFVVYDPKSLGFAIQAAVDNARAVDALAAIRAEYGRVVADGVPEAAVAAQKTRLSSSRRENFRQPEAAAAAMRTSMLAGFPDDYYATRDARLAALPKAEVDETLRARFPKAPLAVLIIAPSANGFSADCVIEAPAEIERCE